MGPPIGVTARRELLEVDDTDSIRERVQEVAAESPIASAISGAYSFPHDWWLAIHWSLGMWGYYGDYMQSKAEEAGRRLETVLVTVKFSSPYTFKAVSAVVNYVLADKLASCVALDQALKRIDRSRVGTSAANLSSAVAGRVAGGLFTTFAVTGGRFGTAVRRSPAQPGIIGSNFALATTGAALRLAIKTGGAETSAADLALAILAGTTKRVITSTATWADIIRGVRDCSYQTNPKEEKHYNAIFRQIRQVRRNVTEGP